MMHKANSFTMTISISWLQSILLAYLMWPVAPATQSVNHWLARKHHMGWSAVWSKLFLAKKPPQQSRRNPHIQYAEKCVWVCCDFVVINLFFVGWYHLFTHIHQDYFISLFSVDLMYIYIQFYVHEIWGVTITSSLNFQILNNRKKNHHRLFYNMPHLRLYFAPLRVHNIELYCIGQDNLIWWWDMNS